MLLFSEDGVSLAVRWSKTIQYRQRILHIILPRTPGSPLCPAQRLVLALRLCNSPPSAPLFTYPTRNGWLPLTVQVFQDKLHKYLGKLNFNPSDNSGHSFRRGGHPLPWNVGFQGDWASNAYENYINPSWEMRKHLAATLGRYIQ